jgi:hypothetical protein
MILLDGSVRPNPFTAAIQRSLLDLPIDSHHRLLDFWLEEADEFAKAIGVDRLALRVMLDRAVPMPDSIQSSDYVDARIERDRAEFRGSGGVLSDVAREYDDDDYLLVSSGAQLLFEPLVQISRRLAERDADVALISHRDGTPGGMLLIRCACLRDVSHVGFVDMNEQALTNIAKEFDVRVCQCDAPTGMPVRTAAGYLEALRRFHQRFDPDAVSASLDPFAEEWRPTFAIIEPDAQVDPTAELLDSVALRGSVVCAGAMVARSIACPGGVVGERETIIGKIIS